MRTLADVLRKLAQWDINPDEVPISNPVFYYLINQAEAVLDTDEEEEEET